MVLKLIAVGILAAILLIDVGYAASEFPLNDKYPEIPTENVEDTYIGSTKIPDPYRYLETPEDARTKKFINDEKEITNRYLARGTNRADIKARYQELWNIEKYDGPFQKGKNYFSYRNGVLYVQDSLNDAGKIFLDPATISGTLDKTVSEFSPNGLIFAYLTTKSGSDSSTIQFKHLEQAGIYSEILTDVKYSSITWTNDSKGIFYSSYRDSSASASGSGSSGNKIHKLYYHKLGSDQKSDIEVAKFPQISNSLVSSDISDDGKFLVVSVSPKGTNTNDVYFANLETISYTITGELDLIPVVKDKNARYKFVTNYGNKYIFQTDLKAPDSKLVYTNISEPSADSWNDLVPEDDEKVLDWAAPAGDEYLVLSYVHKVATVLQLHKISTGDVVKTFDLDVGTVKAESFYSDKKSKDIFFKFESFFTPGTIYQFNLSDISSNPKIIKEIVVPNFKASDYTFKQVEFSSDDGTIIPMYITHRNNLNTNGKNFAFMTAIGGFGIKNLPYFSVNRIAVIDNMDGVHAVPNIRGGGEFGEGWYKDGYKRDKQNSMDDLEAAAQFLIEEDYTNSELLAIDGGAAGTSGPLIGAVLNQKPDMFGAVIAEAGLMDMLRFDKFPIGENWVSEYGSTSDKKDFEVLKGYSPLHNVEVATTIYPATMLITSAYDDRVPALHSLKFIATLQDEAKKNPAQLEEAVDITLFIAMNTGATFRK